jgi:hypothetical protein
MIDVMRRLFHTALGLWFVIAMTMAQGCIGPAQGTLALRGGAASSPDASSSSQSAYAGGVRNVSRSSGPIDTSGYVVDPGASSALTDHLHHHRLPLVGAQVLRNPNTGARVVVLFGYVGSDFGKSDAQRQAEDFINDAAVEVDNRVHVKPELLATGRSSQTPSAPSSPDMADSQADANAAMPGAQSYLDQQNQAAQVQQYQQQNSSASMSAVVPLIVLLGILSMASGGGFSTGPSGGYSPYGYSPYSPYSGYGSPGMPPSTFGGPGYGYGSSGGGVTPFGSLPGSPYYSTP